MGGIELPDKRQPDNRDPEREGESVEKALDSDRRLIFSAEKCPHLRHDEASYQRTDQQTDSMKSGWTHEMVGKEKDTRDTRAESKR